MAKGGRVRNDPAHRQAAHAAQRGAGEIRPGGPIMSKPTPIEELLTHINNKSNTCMRTPGQFDLRALVFQTAGWITGLEKRVKALQAEVRELKK